MWLPTGFQSDEKNIVEIIYDFALFLILFFKKLPPKMFIACVWYSEMGLSKERECRCWGFPYQHRAHAPETTPIFKQQNHFSIAIHNLPFYC